MMLSASTWSVMDPSQTMDGEKIFGGSIPRCCELEEIA